jgi:transposase
MRATRDLLRRRCHLVRQRAELFAHIQKTNRPYNLPELGKRLTPKAKRAGVAQHFPALSVRKPLEGEVALLAHYDQVLREVELSLPRTAKGQEGQSFARLQSVPGGGPLLALVLRYEIPDLARFPRGQDFVSYCRLVKGAKASGGKRYGLSGKKIGTPQLKWAFSEAATLFLRQNQPGRDSFTQLARKPGKGKALTVLAHKLARAVSSLRTREQPFALHRFVAAYPLRGETEPAA